MRQIHFHFSRPYSLLLFSSRVGARFAAQRQRPHEPRHQVQRCEITVEHFLTKKGFNFVEGHSFRKDKQKWCNKLFFLQLCPWHLLLVLFTCSRWFLHSFHSSHLSPICGSPPPHPPLSIQEFKFMGQCRSPSVSPSRQAASSSGPAQEELSLFQLFLLEGNPFERHIEHKEEETEDVLASNGVSVYELGCSPSSSAGPVKTPSAESALNLN